jgi:hypothetical protein
MADLPHKTNLVLEWIFIHPVITLPILYWEVTYSLPSTLTTTTAITGTTTG